MSAFDTSATGRLKKLVSRAGSSFVQEPSVSKESSTTLKKVANSSTWVSPFRTGESKKLPNLYRQYYESNKMDKIQVPRRFQATGTAATAKTSAAATTKETSQSDANASSKSLKDEPISTPKAEETAGEEIDTFDVESERPLNEEEINHEANGAAEKAPEVAQDEPEAAAEATGEELAEKEEEVAEKTESKAVQDDNIEQKVKETPIELVTQPELKYEPVAGPNQEVLEKLKDKPKLLSHYQELNTAAVGSVSKHLDDPNKVIDLGQGLKMSQQQLLDIAAKRVAPVLASINDAVDKTRQDDALKREQLHDQKVEKHKSKLLGEFDKYVRKVSQKKEKYNREIDAKFAQIEKDHKQANTEAEEFEATTKKEIETVNTEFADRETKAVEKHANDKETLVKNHEELEATKKQELEEAKTGQATTTQEIEELQEKKITLDDENSQLSTKIEELTAQLEEQTAKLNELKEHHQTEVDAIARNKSTKEELDTKIATTKKDLEDKKSKHTALTAEVGVLAGVLAGYSTKLTSLNQDKEDQAKRLVEAKDKYTSWQTEKQELAAQVAKDHERQRLEATQAAETKKHNEELERQRAKEEQERLEKEQAEAKEKQDKLDAEERERKAKQEAEDLEKLKKEQAEAEEKAELLRLKNQREEEERLKQDPETQRQVRIQQRTQEQQRLLDEKAENDRIYLERSQKEQEEAENLQREIEELEKQKTAKTELDRLEAEKLANAKLLEIEKLKDEHEERLRLYQEKLDFEELQKSRLLEEVEHLKKIKELRQEKARLAAEVNRKAQFEDIQNLIDNRELEIAKLTKQIEFDDNDLSKFAKKEVSGNVAKESVPEVSTSGVNVAKEVVPQVSTSATTDSAEPKKKKLTKLFDSSAGVLTGAGVAAGATAAAVAGAAASGSKSATQSAAQAIPIENTASAPSVSKSVASSSRTLQPESRSSFSKLKSLGSKFTSSKEKLVSSNSNNEKAVSKESAPKIDNGSGKTASVNVAKQPAAVDSAKAENDDEYDTYSVYEEVDSDEYEENQGNPDYLLVTEDEYQKHKA